MESSSLYQKKLVTGSYHPQVVAYYFKQWDDFRMDYHEHNAVEIMYVIQGTCRIGFLEQSVSLKKGDVILIDADVAHRLIVEKNAPCRMLNVEFTFVQQESPVPSLKQLASESEELSAFFEFRNRYIVLKDPNEIFHNLKSLVMELDEQGLAQGMMVQLLLSQLLIRIARLACEARNREAQPADLYVRKTIEFLHQHYDCDIQAKDIASYVNLHPGYLHRIFKANTGTTLTEYLTALRMEKAKMLLARTEIPVVEISDYIGINSRQYFSTIFKKCTGKTPIEYRKSLQRHVLSSGELYKQSVRK